MTPNLFYQLTVENNNSQSICIACECNEFTDERYTLRLASGEIIILEGEEFDSLSRIVDHFRKLKGIL